MKRASKEAKRRTIVKGRVAGKPTKTIAREAATTPRNVQRIAAEPETQFLITECFKPHRKRLTAMAARAVSVVLYGMGAQRCVKVDKDTWEWHGDAIARLRAVERYESLIALLQGKVTETPVDTNRLPTWEEFNIMYQNRKDKSDEETAG